MTCTRCKGNKQVAAFEIKDGQRVGQPEMLPCPTCHASGEVTLDEAYAWKQFSAACTTHCTCGRDALPTPVEDYRTGQIDYVCRRCGRKSKITKRARV